jgi:cytosine/creatinine deaminase
MRLLGIGESMDLKIVNARLMGEDGLWTIAIAQHKISHVVPADQDVGEADKTIDAQRQLLIPGFVNAHFHLDKALILERSPAVEGTFDEALRETLRLKQGFTVTDIQARARRLIEQAIDFGTTAMRSHVEVDTIVGLTAMEALIPIREEYAWGITLQLAVFAQEGITNYPQQQSLLRQAMSLGGDVIGSAPYVDSEPERNVEIVFDIAQEFNCDVDFHLDYLDDEMPMLLPFVMEQTIKRGWQGRVCLGHMTKLAGLSPQELRAIALTLRDAGISILALPASDLYMMARRDSHNVRRGVAPVHTLANMGVNAGFAVNNVQNLFTPFGDGDMLKIGTLLAQVLQMGTSASHQLCMEMATVRAARAIGIENYGVAVGNVADLVILEAESATQAIGIAPVGRVVIKNGRIVAKSWVERAASQIPQGSGYLF